VMICGHGAVPNVTIDPVVAAAQIITALQTIVSRNVGPLQSAVISVTTVHTGTAFNVIPHEAVLTGTIRTFDLEVRKKVLEKFEQIVRGIGETMGCKVEIEVVRVTPALINNDEVTAKVQETALRVLVDSTHDHSAYLTMGAEDMAYMQEVIPGCYFFIGSNNKERHLDNGHHHPKFDFDEEALAHGAALMAAAAADILK
jgi:amidohydrolase